MLYVAPAVVVLSSVLLLSFLFVVHACCVWHSGIDQEYAEVIFEIVNDYFKRILEEWGSVGGKNERGGGARIMTCAE